MKRIGVIADDLTGATTTGVLLARCQAKTTVYIENGSFLMEQNDTNSEAIIVNTDSRAMSPNQAYAKVYETMQGMKAKGDFFFSKRIDTTMRGQIGNEIDAMLDEMGENAVALVVPAMPQSGRILVGGYSIIDGIPLIRTPVAKDVRTPVTENNITRLLSKQTRRKVGLLELQTVLDGVDAIRDALYTLRENGCQVFLCDSVSEEDVRCIAKACVSLNWNVLAVDPGPFTMMLSQERNIISEEQNNLPEYQQVVNTEKFVIAAVGSASSTTRKQIQRFCEESRVIEIRLNPNALIDDEEHQDIEINRAIEYARKQIEKAGNLQALILDTAADEKVLNLQLEDATRGYPSGMCSNKINKALGKAVYQLLKEYKKSVAGLYCTGGDTAVAVCKVLDVPSLTMIDYVIPQTDLSRMNGPFEGLIFVGKGGLTGHETIVQEIVNRILQMA